MGDDFADKWVREHKKEFAEQLIRKSGARKVAQPAAIFMAGLPGAGKTEFTKNWIAASGLKVVRLDMDEIASQIETYAPEEADKFRKSASTLLSYVFDKVISGKYDFVMDGTFGGGVAIQNIERVLKRGYYVRIFYLHQDPKVAWNYTLAREKIEHRSIEIEGFLETYFKIFNNLEKLETLTPGQITCNLMIKNAQNEIERTIRDIPLQEIDKYISREYNKDELRKRICDGD